jgi:hypothetical protein
MIQGLWSLEVDGGFWKLTFEQDAVTWAIPSFDHIQNENSLNFENKSHR